MVLKRYGKRGTKRKKNAKVSIAKLSNKHLNKLAKQGKLKSKQKPQRQKLLQLIEDRVHPEKQRHLNPVARAPEPEDIPLEEADYEFYSRPGRDLSFLGDKSNFNAQKRKNGEENGDLVERYEKNPRMSKGNVCSNKKVLLPIKSKDGDVISQLQEEVSEGDGGLTETPGDHITPQTTHAQEALPALSTLQVFRLHQDKLQQKKQEIAALASTILENPEDGMKRLKDLRGFLRDPDPDLYLTLRKLAMASLLEVFKDIIPSYRIRMSTESEKTQSAKKETRKLREGEDLLLSNYRQYLESLEAAVKGKLDKRHQEKNVHETSKLKGVRELAVRCLCELLLSHPHFNYRTNIISLVVPMATDKNVTISDAVCSYIKKIFKVDKSREVTLEIVRLIGRIVKTRQFNVQSKILETFLSLKIKSVNFDSENKAARKQKLKQMSRKEKKKHKQMRALERELEDASLVTNKERILKLNTEIINMIFLTYFRILKTARHSSLLSTVLEGLAMFAHLINIDFFDDLFEVIGQLIDSETLTYRESLHCVQTAFVILSGQGQALNIDPNRYYKHLYSTMFCLNTGVSSDDLPLALRCLELMLSRRRKQVSPQRLLAFFKRITTLALSMSSAGGISCLCVARNLLITAPRCDLLLDTESRGSGIFLPELDEPEHCNAHQAALYELHQLRNSFDPVVRKLTSNILNGAPSQGKWSLPTEISKKNAMELYELHNAPPVPVFSGIKKQRCTKKSQVLPSGEFLQKSIKDDVDAVNIPDSQIQTTDFTENLHLSGDVPSRVKRKRLK